MHRQPTAQTTPRLIGRVWRLLDGRQRRRLAWVAMLSGLSALSTVGGIAAIVPFLRVYGDPRLIEQGGLLRWAFDTLGFNSAHAFTLFLGAAFLVILLLANLLNFLSNVATNRVAHEIGRDLHVALFAEYLRRDCLFHATHDGAALANNVTFEVNRLATGLIAGLLTLISSAFAVVSIAVAVLIVNPLAGAWSLALFATSYAAMYAAVRGRLHRYGQTQTRLWRERATLLAESFAAIREILLLRRPDHFRDEFAGQCASIARSAWATLAIAQVPRNLLECVAAVVLLGVALSLGDAGQGSYALQLLSFLGLAAYRMLPAMHQAFSALAHVRAGRAGFESVERDLLASRSQAPRIAAGQDPDPEWLARPRVAIELREVCFRYRQDLADAVHRVNLSIPAGSRMALVGANGSGKTTLADLVVGLLTPHSGSIEVDGRGFGGDARPSWQSTVGYVQQTCVLQNASLAENIALGVAPADIDYQRLAEAARQAQLTRFIGSLPGEYAERLGERGVRLSGGQRQLVGIARALYRRSSLLVLDEAASALDADTEHAVLEAICAGPKIQTLIMITHRARCVRHCDFVVTMESGRVAEVGTCDQLLARPAATWLIQELQA